VVIRAELSGVASEDLRVHVDGPVVRLSGERKVPAGEEVRRLHQMEVTFGPFERSVRVSIPFERDRVSAQLENGFLEVTLPKRGPRRVHVEKE
jgi:HSP20 family protein